MRDKVRESDFTSKELPKTRKSQFKDLITRRFVSLLKLSLLETIFLMPLLVSIITFHIFIRNSKDFNQAFTVTLFTGIALLISIPIAYIGAAGLSYALKQLVWREGEFAASSFFLGLREEGKRCFFIGLIVGVIAMHKILELKASSHSPSIIFIFTLTTLHFLLLRLTQIRMHRRYILE